MMMKSNSLKTLIYFLIGVAVFVLYMLHYLSSYQDEKIEVGQVWRNRKKIAEYQDLARVLKNAAMNDNTVILTTLNAAWAAPNSILDLFLESFHIGEQTEQLLKHLVIIAVDPMAFDRCKSIHSHCYYFTIEGMNLASEQLFMSKNYLEMMWRRLEFLGTVLELGYNFLFTDMDIMWFRSPFPHLSGNAHFITASDIFNGNSSDIQNLPNNGFVYVKSCQKTIVFYKYWYLARKLYPGDHEQTVFNKMKGGDIFAKFQLQMRFLDTAYFGGFCQPSKDLNKVCTMHANCCVGIQKKLHDLRILLDDWKDYKARPADKKKGRVFTWRVPDKCKLKKTRGSALG